MVLIYLALTVIGAAAWVVMSFQLFPLLIAIVASIFGAVLWVAAAVLAYGLFRKSQPLRPFDAAELQRSATRWGGEGRHIVTGDGRIVEYLVYGSKRPDAKTIVQMHGSGTTGGWQCRMNGPLLEALNLKGIAPTVPCHGYSDLHIGRQIADFPADLAHILDAEGVDQFMVEGTSFGTAHAMAIARHFGPERCIAMGLNGPYLPQHICREFGFRSDGDMLPTPDARTWYQAWNFVFADLVFAAPLLSPPGKFMHFMKEGNKTRHERPWVFETIEADQKERLVARGAQGQGWEAFSVDVTTIWGFDPREIQTKNIAVWYAKDDSAVPPEHGEWLADLFSSRPHTKTDIRSENAGFGHFTYMPSRGPAFQADEQTMPQTLLELTTTGGS